MMQELLQLQQMLGRPLPFDGEMQKEMLTRAERKIRAGLLFGAISEQHNVVVSDDEVEAKLKEIAEQSGKHVAKVRADYQGERRDQLHNQLLQNKLLEYLLSRATITEAAAEQAAAEPSEEPASKPAAKAKAAKSEGEAAPAKKKAASKKAKASDDEK
jgi:trigger factor